MLYIDWYYIVLVLPALIFAIWASANVNSTFKKYSKTTTARGMTGADAARAVLDANGLGSVKIERVSGNLTDHYDPRTRVIRLSDSVYGSAATAAIGVAAHEAGHAIQHAKGYTPFRIRSSIVPATNFCSQIGIVLIPIGLIMTYLGMNFAWLAYTGVILYSACAVFQLVTLPTEFNASSRAMNALESTGILDRAELVQSRKVLTSAALTYVASMAMTIMTILRFVLIIGNARGNRR